MTFEQVIDEFICSGSNRKHSQERIAYWFGCLRTVNERIQFLKDEYGEGGKGFVFDSKKYAAFFDENGYTVAVGNTINCNATQKLSWEAVEQYIYSKLTEGKYCKQAVIDHAKEIVFKETASIICNLRQAVNRETWDEAMGKDWFTYDWQENEKHMEKLLESDIEALLDRLYKLNFAYQEDKSIMRYRWSNNPETVYDTVQKLKCPSNEWRQTPTTPAEREIFITQDELDVFLIGGRQSCDKRLRIYSFFSQNRSRSQRADFIKSCHGSYEGGSPAWFLTDTSGYEYSNKGLKLYRNGYSMKLSWTELVDHIDSLIRNKMYLSQRDYDRMEDYEREEMGKVIGGFYFNLPKECQRPWSELEANKYSYYGTSKYMKNLAALIDSIDKLESVINGMKAVFSQQNSNNPRYEYMKECIEKISDYCNGSIMFPKDIEVNRAKENAHTGNPFPERIEEKNNGEQYSLFDYFGIG